MRVKVSEEVVNSVVRLMEVLIVLVRLFSVMLDSEDSLVVCFWVSVCVMMKIIVGFGVSVSMRVVIRKV